VKTKPDRRIFSRFGLKLPQKLPAEIQTTVNSNTNRSDFKGMTVKVAIGKDAVH